MFRRLPSDQLHPGRCAHFWDFSFCVCVPVVTVPASTGTTAHAGASSGTLLPWAPRTPTGD